ncbi:MAG: O-antigen ligase family protein [Neptuniibacter sp.]
MHQLTQEENSTTLLSRCFVIAFLGLLVFMPLLEAPKNIFAFSLLIMGIIALVTHRRPLQPIQKIYLLWLAVAGIVTVHTVVSYGYSGEGFRDIFRSLSLGLIITLFYFIRLNEMQLLMAILLGASASLAWGIYDLYINAVPVVEMHSLGHPNHSAIYLQLCICIGLPYLFFARSTIWSKLVIAALLGFMALGILMMQSRAVIAAMVIIICLAFVAAVLARRWIVITALIGMILVSLVSLGSVYSKIVEKHHFWFNHYVLNEQGHLTPRGQINTMSDYVFEQFPLLGIGYENYSDFTANKLRPMLEERGEILPNVVEDWLLGFHPHNTFYDQLTASGIVGFLVFLVFFAYTFRFIWYHRPCKGTDKQAWQIEWWWLSVLFIVFSILAIGLFNSSLRHENAVLTFTMLSYFLTHYDVARNLKSETG